ncbi:MAG: T9SS type A sorting domain-containing protein [bacterium]
MTQPWRTYGLSWTVAILLVFCSFPATAQHFFDNLPFYSPDPAQRAFDSLVASKIPVLSCSRFYPEYTLPSALDNSESKWFPGILSQDGYFSCQQYSGIAYTFAYEINRLRDADGKTLLHKYPPHYTWHFFNRGEQYIGVNFLHSFHAIMEQGQMSNADFGHDTAQLMRGWINGYEKYYRAMKNRIRQVYSIPINSAEGIQTVKQYLFDHLDGSPTGGIACFTASSPYNLSLLPQGTPEAGKSVQIAWYSNPTHGMTIVGYNDSIRYDINSDGQYTNHLDINNDSTVDAKDWEIGGFLLANSYGTWWADTGYFYVLYHAMACDFEHGGVWNNCVYVVETDPDYTPLLTLKVSLAHSVRNQLNFLAGVSQDLSADYPDQLLDFPYFSFQGGPYYMQGFDTLQSQMNLEFGLDVTPLLSYMEPGVPAKFFLIIEERDPAKTGQGVLHQVSFLSYGTPFQEFPCEGAEVDIRDSGITLLAATGTLLVDKPEITSEELPPVIPGETYTTQLQVQGGAPPYRWSIVEPWYKTASSSHYEPFTDQKLTMHSSGLPFATVALPFSFPFFGNQYDTIYVNQYGLIHFSPQHMPYPYLASELDMLDYLASIAPAFSHPYIIRSQDGDGIWVKSTPDSLLIRWKLSLAGEEVATNVEFSLILYPDGSYTTCYGPIETAGYYFLSYAGVSRGDKLNTSVLPVFSLEAESGHSYTYLPGITVGSYTITGDGLLTASGFDSARISNLIVRVTDRRGIRDEKQFQLSDGLLIRTEVVSASGYFQFDEASALKLILKNTGSIPLQDLDLKFSCLYDGLEISDSTETISLLNPGSAIEIDNAFSFRLIQIFHDQTMLPCKINALSSGKAWECQFYLNVAAPDVIIGNEEIQDGVNGLLDVGEVAELVIPVSNMGSLPAENLSFSLTSQSSFLEILSPPSLSVPELGLKKSMVATFLTRASRSATPGDTAHLTLHITNGSNTNIVHPIPIPVGINPVAIITLTTVSSTPEALTTILDSLQVGYDLFTSMPTQLNFYPVVFLILGTSYPGSASLTTEQTLRLISYLTNGGNVYMESYSSWYYGNTEPLEEFFSYSSDRVNVYYFNQVDGVEGTMTEGMAFVHLGPSPYAIFQITPKEDGFSLFGNPDTVPKCVQFAHEGTIYKTIGTFLEFGKLSDGESPSRKAVLLKNYLDFFQLNYTGPFPFFHADTTHICRWRQVQFTDDSFDNVISWQWEFPGGSPSSSTVQNPIVQYVDAGVYDVILTVSDGNFSQTMHKKQYIHVDVCAGAEDPLPAQPTVRIYPNPANGRVSVLFPSAMKDLSMVSVSLFDLQGRKVRQWSLEKISPDKKVSFDLAGLPAGIYILQVITDEVSASGKLVVQ